MNNNHIKVQIKIGENQLIFGKIKKNNQFNTLSQVIEKAKIENNKLIELFESKKYGN